MVESTRKITELSTAMRSDVSCCFFSILAQNAALPVVLSVYASVERENAVRSDNLSESVSFVATFFA